MLTLHHLNNSRSQRILWLLEELGAPYEMKRYQRDAETRLAPPELKRFTRSASRLSSPTATGRSPNPAPSSITSSAVTGKGAMMPAQDSAD